MDAPCIRWIAAQLEPLGESVRQIEPVFGGDDSSVFAVSTDVRRYYFKICGAPFTHEPQLASALDSWLPGSVPRVLATDTERHWLLMADAGPLLRTRIRLLQKEIAQARTMIDTAHSARLPRLLLIEGEYHVAMREAELSWVQRLADELEAGTLEGQDGWRHVYETGEAPKWDLDVTALEKLRELAEGGTPPG